MGVFKRKADLIAALNLDYGHAARRNGCEYLQFVVVTDDTELEALSASEAVDMARQCIMAGANPATTFVEIWNDEATEVYASRSVVE